MTASIADTALLAVRLFIVLHALCPLSKRALCYKEHIRSKEDSMSHRGCTNAQGVFQALFPSNFDGLLSEIPQWVQSAIGRRLAIEKVTFVSAVCPDYDRRDGKFTYERIGGGLPFTAERHLMIMEHATRVLRDAGIDLVYHMTLADTEFDLPLVVERMTGGDAQLFLDRCEQSCKQLLAEAKVRGIPLASCRRFTEVFPQWLTYYGDALLQMRGEVESDSSVRCDLELNAGKRAALYQAMASKQIDTNYCREMVLRQWAQYMAWGRCAEEVFGKGIIMMNHKTPNLSRVNHPFMRNGHERIPIIQLDISTLPG